MLFVVIIDGLHPPSAVIIDGLRLPSAVIIDELRLPSAVIIDGLHPPLTDSAPSGLSYMYNTTLLSALKGRYTLTQGDAL